MLQWRYLAGIVTLAALVCLSCACQKNSKADTMDKVYGQLTVSQIQSEVVSTRERNRSSLSRKRISALFRSVTSRYTQ